MATLVPVLLAEQSYSVPVAIILLSAILGLLVTLRPARRTTEIKRKRN